MQYILFACYMYTLRSTVNLGLFVTECYLHCCDLGISLALSKVLLTNSNCNAIRKDYLCTPAKKEKIGEEYENINPFGYNYMNNVDKIFASHCPYFLWLTYFEGVYL